VVETSPDTTVVPPALVTDDTAAYRGLLVNDTDGNWTRYTPPAGQLPNVVLNNQGTQGPPPAVAGYFTSATGNSGDEIYASYGNSPASLSWSNSNKLECEAIAHWPETMVYGALPAKMYWSMFPGHRIYMPGTSTFVTDSAEGWDAFRRIFDIDPTVTPAGRAGAAWNAGNFTFTGLLAEGRIVEFDYRTVNGWNPDLNRDTDSNTPADAAADKFPIRCRLFTDYTTYIDSDPGTGGVQPYVWPNNQPPTTSYVEGGCYVVDTGLPVYRVKLTTNGDPLVAGSTGNYTISLPFRLKFGSPNYTVTCDADYNGTWGSAPSGRVFPVTGFDNTTAGVKTGSVAITTMPDGNYNFAIRVVDAAGDVSTAVYPNQVPLFPTHIFKETFEGGAQTITNADLTWTASGPQGSYNYDYVNQTGAAVYYGFTAHAGSRYGKWSATDQYYLGTNAQRWFTTGPYTVVPNTFYKIELYSNGQCAYVFSYYHFAGMRAQWSYDNSTWNDMPANALYYGYNYNYNIDKAWGYGELGAGTWTYHSKTMTTGATNTQVWFRYGFESDPYYTDGYATSYPNYGGPAIDDIKMWPPPPPPPPIWTETFEGGMGNWTNVGSSGTITMVQASGANLGTPAGAQGGTYYMMTTPRQYPNSSWCRYSLASPITVTANTTYNLQFFTAGNSEGNYDGLMVGYSFNNSTWTWTGPNSFYGHASGPYTGYSSSTLGGATWTQQMATITTGAGQTQLWLQLGWEADSSVYYEGPAVDTMTLGLP